MAGPKRAVCGASKWHGEHEAGEDLAVGSLSSGLLPGGTARNGIRGRSPYRVFLRGLDPVGRDLHCLRLGQESIAKRLVAHVRGGTAPPFAFRRLAGRVDGTALVPPQDAQSRIPGRVLDHGGAEHAPFYRARLSVLKPGWNRSRRVQRARVESATVYWNS